VQCAFRLLSLTVYHTLSPIISVKSNVQWITQHHSSLSSVSHTALRLVLSGLDIPLSTTLTSPSFLSSPPTPIAPPPLPHPPLPSLSYVNNTHHFLTLPFPSSSTTFPPLTLFSLPLSPSSSIFLSFYSLNLFFLSVSICRCVFVQSAQLMDEIPAEEAAPESGERTTHV
jgi:hypothetical protein